MSIKDLNIGGMLEVIRIEKYSHVRLGPGTRATLRPSSIDGITGELEIFFKRDDEVPFLGSFIPYTIG